MLPLVFYGLKAVAIVAKGLRLDRPSATSSSTPTTTETSKSQAFIDGLLEEQIKDETSFPDRVSEISMFSLIMSVVIGLPVFLAAMYFFGQKGMASFWYAFAAMYIVICFKYPIVETTFLFLIYIGLGLSFFH